MKEQQFQRLYSPQLPNYLLNIPNYLITIANFNNPEFMKKNRLTEGFKKYILLLILCFGITASQGQITGPMSPGGLLDKVVDQKGRTYHLQDLVVNDSMRPHNPSGASGKLVVPVCSSGYFQLYLDSACGLDSFNYSTVQMDRLQVFCQVLHDISAFIHSPCDSTGQKVNIWVRNYQSVNLPSNAEAEASSFFCFPDNMSLSGIADNMVWQTIISGKDPYKSVVTPLLSSDGFFHGMVAFNPNLSWNASLTAGPTSTQLDLYSTIYHEFCHALGLFSLINKYGQSNLVYNYYSRYDQFLKSGSQYLIAPNVGACNPMYDDVFATSLTVLQPHPTDTVPDYTDCLHAIQFVGSATLNIYTPNVWETGSSLSHFEDECPPISNNNGYYLMANASATGSIHRILQPEERHALCDIGYTVDTTFGDALHLNYKTYTGGICPGTQVAGFTDGIDTAGVYSFIAAAGTSVIINTTGHSLLDNDYDADSITCLQVVVGGTGTFNHTSGNANTTITYTPGAGSTQGVQLLRYIPMNKTTGKPGNITYIYVRVSSSLCGGSTCNMIVNGDFESGTGCGQFPYATPFPNPTLDCWDYFSGSPDIFSTTCATPQAGFVYSGIPQLDSDPPTLVHQNSANPNNRFIGLGGVRTPAGFGAESLQTTLTSALIPGNTYTLTFWAKNMEHQPYYANGTIDAPLYIQFISSTNTLTPGVAYPLSAGMTVIKDTVLPADFQWHPYSIKFT